MPYDIFVIGTASLDTLHLPTQVAHSVGGAGLYTALAAQHAGAEVGLYAPHPDPMPTMLQPISPHLHWLGPTISPDEVARLEIAHYGGGQAKLLSASWGAEPDFLPDNIPTEVASATIVHIAALSSAQRQLDFLLALLNHADSEETILSVGTYGLLVYEQRERVQQLFDLANIFFMNENEAKGFFGTVEQAKTHPESLLFVTLGAEGALVIEGDQVTHVPAIATDEVDPTGAGDTFCGATLAGLIQGLSPIAAAQEAVILAARTVGAIGVTGLLES